jgi:hypothetical protein
LTEGRGNQPQGVENVENEGAGQGCRLTGHVQCRDARLLDGIGLNGIDDARPVPNSTASATSPAA